MTLARKPAAAPTAPPAAARPSRGAIWLMAIRPRTLPAAVGPVLVGLGVALAGGVFVPLPALAALAVALLLQVAANLANDLFDFRSGADAEDRLGPPRTAALGLLGQRDLVAGIALVLAATAAVGLYLVTVGGLPILVLGLLAVISLLAYTGGPWPYGYHGLGEVFVFTFFGLVAVAGTTYLQTGALEPLAVVAAVPVGALVAAILVVNNLRDIDSDQRAGKRTLAVRLGVRGTVGEYGVLVAVAFAGPVAAIVAGAYPTVLLAWLTAPMAWRLLGRIREGGDPRRLNPVLGGTALLSLRYSALFALGLAIGGLETVTGIALP